MCSLGLSVFRDSAKSAKIAESGVFRRIREVSRNFAESANHPSSTCCFCFNSVPFSALDKSRIVGLSYAVIFADFALTTSETDFFLGINLMFYAEC